MRKLALQVEHKFKNRVVGHHLVEGPLTATIGSSRNANIRLLGDEVAGLHAAFELEDSGACTLLDLGSKSGTWVNQKPVIEHKVDGATVIHIGNHQLKATPHVLDRELFAKDLDAGTGAHTYHQVVVLRKGLLQRVLLLEQKEAYDAAYEGLGRLNAPTGHDWTVTENGDFTIKQRLTKSDVLKTTARDEMAEEWRKPTPLIAAALMFLMVIGVLLLAPQKPDDSLKTLTPEMQNQYTRMIFDGKKVREKKEIAQKMRKQLQGQSQQGVAKTTPGGDSGAKAAGAAKPGAKVVLNLNHGVV